MTTFWIRTIGQTVAGIAITTAVSGCTSLPWFVALYAGTFTGLLTAIILWREDLWPRS